MLYGISPLLSPDLLAVLYRLGHGDEIVLADAHFPGESFGKRLVRADGLRIAGLLDAILPGIQDNYLKTGDFRVLRLKIVFYRRINK